MPVSLTPADMDKHPHVNARIARHVYQRLQDLPIYSEEGIRFRTVSDKIERLLNVWEKHFLDRGTH